VHHLAPGHDEALERLSHLAAERTVGAARGVLPGGAEVVTVLLDVGTAVLGERGRVAAVDPFELDEALVLELLEHGVDGSRAGRPGIVAAFSDLLDQLVSVGRVLGEQQ
jgi:hypothetical protein